MGSDTVGAGVGATGPRSAAGAGAGPATGEPSPAPGSSGGPAAGGAPAVAIPALLASDAGEAAGAAPTGHDKPGPKSKAGANDESRGSYQLVPQAPPTSVRAYRGSAARNSRGRAQDAELDQTRHAFPRPVAHPALYQSVVERLGDLVSRLEPVLAALLEQALEDLAERRGKVSRRRLDGLPGTLSDRPHVLVVVRSLEHPFTTKHLHEEEAQAEEVRPPVDLAGLGPAAGGLLRAQVRVIPADEARLRPLPVRHTGPGHPEVEELHKALPGHHDVVGAHVTMYQSPVLLLSFATPQRVGVVKRLCHALADVATELDRQPSGPAWRRSC